MTLPSGSGHRPVTQFHHQGRVRHHDCFALRAEPQTMRCRVSLGLATNKALRSRKIDLIGHIHDFEDQDFTIGERDHSRGGADFVTLQPNSAPACGWRTKVGCQRSVSLVIVSRIAALDTELTIEARRLSWLFLARLGASGFRQGGQRVTNLAYLVAAEMVEEVSAHAGHMVRRRFGELAASRVG